MMQMILRGFGYLVSATMFVGFVALLPFVVFSWPMVLIVAIIGAAYATDENEKTESEKE